MVIIHGYSKSKPLTLCNLHYNGQNISLLHFSANSFRLLYEMEMLNIAFDFFIITGSHFVWAGVRNNPGI